jgi:DNA-binding NarL/FixJ family response regulator
VQLKRRVRVLVADDHPSIRENLRYLIDAEPDLSCIGVAKDGRQCIALCSELQPDALVLDHDMPGLDGLVVTRMLERAQPRIRVIVYTLNAEVCSVAQALGAVACITKDAPYESLLRAIRQGAAVGSAVA